MQKSQNTGLKENADDTTIELEEMSEEEKFFKNYNFNQVDYKDPSLEGNFIKIFEEEIPFEIRIEGENPPLSCFPDPRRKRDVRQSPPMNKCHSRLEVGPSTVRAACTRRCPQWWIRRPVPGDSRLHQSQ